MLRATWLRGRRGALIGASTAVVCLGGLLASCAGGTGGDGYVAVGPAGGTALASGTAVAPTGDVTLVPLDGPAGPGAARAHRSGASDSTAGNTPSPGVTPDGVQDTSGTPAAGTSPSPQSTPSGRTNPGTPSRTASAPRTTPGGPAALSVGESVREATDKRWCEKVTVPFHNTGGAPVRSGTVTFETHIIGALGIDWATIESTGTLPAPIAAGASVERTWTVCVDEWRVPLGMHIETRDVSVQWK
ncbi:hypothetical protein ABT173_18845 [Streptomyces sp. NPDC001795]|uniref:hypothetical protein n=1 Tax=Streptomyces sp. NPDC001795 TaxID=3154525 RepID=UPI0033225144